MPVRVRVKLKSRINNREIETLALLNTGFTTDELDIIVPKHIAEKLGLWPPPNNAILETLETPGGEILSYLVLRSIELSVVEEDKISGPILCNAIISLYEKEVLLSDTVIEELGIEILSPKTGYWRFKGENKIRKSY